MNNEIETLRKEYAELIDNARKVADAYKGKEMDAEAAKNINQTLGKADELKAKIVMLEKLSENEAYLNESTGIKAAHLGWREAGPDEGNVQYDMQAWHEVDVRTEAVEPGSGRIVLTERKLRYYVPLATQKKGYKSAFEAYLMKGQDRIGPDDAKTLTEGTDSAGGFLVPEDYHVELIKKIAAQATIRPNARVVTTSRSVTKWPTVKYNGDDKYTSGVRMTWTGEVPASSTTHRVTEPVFGQAIIPVHTAMASMPLSNDMIEDSAFDILGISSDLFAEAFALGENEAFIGGDGAHKPLGILAQVDAGGPVSVKSGNASALTADGLIDLAYALPAQYERNAKWYMNKSTELAIRKLKDTTNNYLWPIAAVGGFGAVQSSLLDYPRVRDEFVPAIAANSYPIIFGDLNGYLIVDRVGISIQRLTELYAETDIVLLLARKRVGGQVVEPWRIKVQKIAT